MRSFIFILFVFAAVSGTVKAQAADPLAVELIAGDGSLTGWDYGESRPGGWAINDGVLSVLDEGEFVGGWTLGDFELAFAWRVVDGSVWTIGLLPVDDKDNTPWEITLDEGPDCGTVRIGDVKHRPKGALPESKSLRRQAILRRFGQRLALIVDGATIVDVELPDASRRVPRLVARGGYANIGPLALDEPVGPAVLSGGLESWSRTSNGKPWTWADGEVRAPGDGSNYLRSDEQFANFIATLEYKQPAGGNSGIGIRTPPGGWPSGDGMELQLYDHDASMRLNKQSTAAIYGNVEPLTRADRADAWNRVVVRAEGYLITVWVNGVLVQHCNTRNCPELKYRKLSGWIGLQDHNDPARFRNIHIARLPSGTGPAVWYAARPEPASRWALEPLMNSERLAEAMPPLAMAIDWKVEPGKSPPLELPGPGAIVRIATLGDVGSLQLFLDGEDAESLPQDRFVEAIPLADRTGDSLTTYVPFKQSARLVRTGDSPATIRIEAVRLPAAVEQESISPPLVTVERGLLSAMHYREQQLEHGRCREGDDCRTESVHAGRLEPGERLAVSAMFDVRGVIKRVELRAPAGVLDDDDAWIEVTVDGEREPALACPARYFFPGLGAGSYANFVVTRDRGYVSLLGMPFSRGYEIALRNRGADPLGKNSPFDVELIVTVDENLARTAAAVDAQMRLRGVWVEPGQAARPTVAVSSRLIGIVGKQAETLPALFGGVPAALSWGLYEAGDQRNPLCGRAGGLVWRWLLPAAVEFDDPLKVVPIPLTDDASYLLLYYGRAK